MVPICREDLVCLPTKVEHPYSVTNTYICLQVANGLGFQSPLILITKISSLVHMIDPFSMHIAEMYEKKDANECS